MNDWLVVGISGVTCSGKTSLTNAIHDKLSNNSVIINQDDYFLSMDNPKHTPLPELNHYNFDIISSLDMNKMFEDVVKIIDDKKSSSSSSCDRRILIIDGFLIFSYKPIADLCDLKYFMTLDKEICWERRKLRHYDPPDVPGYFEKVVWPEYLKHKAEIHRDKNLEKGIKFIDGSRTKKNIFDDVYADIKNHLDRISCGCNTNFLNSV